MQINNNRYRKSIGEYAAHFKHDWRIYLAILGTCLVCSTYIVSLVMQWVCMKAGELAVVHCFNPFYIIYYGLARSAGITFIIWILSGAGICYYRFYITMVDYEYDRRGFPISPNGTYGTNRIMGSSERDSFLEKTTVSKTEKNIVYKDENDGSVYVLKNTDSIGPHKFVCGSSGSWKTSSQFVPDMMQTIRRGESMICTDPKGELRSKTYLMAKKHNYIVREFNLIQPILSDGCDFMGLVENYGDARTFTEIIMSNTSGDAMHNEDFWAKGERAAICFGILYVKEAGEYTGKRSFGNVFHFLKLPLEELDAKADALPEGSDAKNQWKIFQTTPDNSKGGIMTGVATRLQILNDQAIDNITSRDEIDITLPGRRPCIYYVLMSDQESTNNVIASIFFSFLFIKLVKTADQRLNQMLPVAVNFLLDEMPNIGRIPDFPKKLSTIRSRNMKCTICTQDIGQLKDMYPGNLWANIVSNCDTQVNLGCNDPEVTAKFWENAYGTMTIIVETERTTVNRFRPVTVNSMKMQNTGEGKREVFTVGEICGMENRFALIRFRCHNVIMGLKFSYFEHPMYEEIEEENYFTHRPLWWGSVAEEAKAGNPDEYRWFAEGLETLNRLNAELEAERQKKREQEERTASAYRVARMADSGTETGAGTPGEKTAVLFLRARRILAMFMAYLHPGPGSSTETAEPETMQEDRNLDRALKETLERDGTEDSGNTPGSADTGNTEIAPGNRTGNLHSGTETAGEPVPGNRTGRNVAENFKPAPEPERTAEKPAPGGRIDFGSVIDRMSRKIPEPEKQPDGPEENLPEPEQFSDIPEPDFDGPDLEEPDFMPPVWAETTGSMPDTYDTQDDDIPEPEDPEGITGEPPSTDLLLAQIKQTAERQNRKKEKVREIMKKNAGRTKGL